MSALGVAELAPVAPLVLSGGQRRHQGAVRERWGVVAADLLQVLVAHGRGCAQALLRRVMHFKYDFT